MKNFLSVTWRPMIAYRCFLVSILSCSANLSHAQFPDYPDYRVPENAAGTHYMLGIIAYNYTDRYIDSFSIDGQGGGDVRLSTPTSGGSSTMCCVLLAKNPKWPMRVLVRWTVGGCKKYEKNRKYSQIQYSYKEEEIDVEHDLAIPASDIAVHFYEGGKVRVRLSDGWEAPLLKLPKGRPDREFFPECKQK